MTASRYRALVPYCVLIVLATVMLAILKIPLTRLDVPYTFFGDAIDKLAQINNVAETGWLFHNDRLGYPFGYDRLDFPRFDSLNYALMWPLAVFGNPALAMNVYFIAGFYLTAFAAFYCFRKLGLRNPAAILCALLYAFLPYHVLRGVAHLTNGAYFLVPLAMLVLFRLAQGEFDQTAPDVRRRWLLALAIALLVPLQTPYNGVFFAFLCVVAATIALSRRVQWRSVLVAVSLLCAMGAAFVVEQIPVLMHARHAGTLASVANRSPAEAQMYSMQLNQVLLPTNADRRPVIARTMEKFADAAGVPLAENRNQYIGALGVFGFAALLWALSRSTGTRTFSPPDRTDLENSVRIAGLLAICIILLAVSSGLCTAIAYWITAKMRAYNRILPFFAFACLLGGGWALQAWLEWIRSTAWRTCVLLLISVVLLLDVLVPLPFPERSEAIGDFDRARVYFAGVERRLGDGAAVFQLPAVWYPEHTPVNDMNDYEEFKPFLFTRSLRFSYGVSNGRSGYSWGKYVERLPATEMIARAYAMGFAALLIDTTAYADTERDALTDALGAALTEPPSISTDKRWWVFPLRGCCGPPLARIENGAGPRVFAYKIGDDVRFVAGASGFLYAAGGLGDPESWGAWTSGTDSWLRMRLDPPPSGPLMLMLDTQMMLGPQVPRRRLRIDANGHRVADIVYEKGSAVQRLHVDIPADTIGPDGVLELHLNVTPEASPSSAGVNNDGRSLGVGLIGFSITSAADMPPPAVPATQQ